MRIPTPLKIARISAGLSQSDLAAKIERGHVFVHRLETDGCAVLTSEIAEKIASAVGVPAVVIFSGMKTRQR